MGLGMFKKYCPWCHSKITAWQLGSRPRKKVSFFSVRPNLAVCPYCAKPVKMGGKSLFFLLAFIPVITLGFVPIYTDYEMPDWFFIVAVTTIMIAFIVAMTFSVFNKDDDL